MFVSVRVNRFLAVFLIVCAAVVAAAGFPGVVAVSGKAEPAQGIQLPIIMYHSIIKDRSWQGTYVVSPDLLESDFRYLQAKGYHAIFVQDLLNYVDAGVPLPAKPVMLTFDDGYYNNYLYAYPLSKKYNSKIVIAPIGYYSDFFSITEPDQEIYSHLTWNEIREMSDSGLVEFQNHTYNLHANKGRLGAEKLQSESDLAYESMLRADIGKLQSELLDHTGITPTAFVYPYGIVSKQSVTVLKSMGFRCSMTCESKMNYITPDPQSLYSLGRYLRPSGTASYTFFSRIGVK